MARNTAGTAVRPQRKRMSMSIVRQPRAMRLKSTPISPLASAEGAGPLKSGLCFFLCSGGASLALVLEWWNLHREELAAD